MVTRYFPAPVLALALAAGPALGDATSSATAEAVDEIVVVANKQVRPVRDVAASVLVVNRADLDANLAISLDDIFRYSPGIDQEAAGNRFGDEGINIRGIGGDRVAILIDGVPLADQFAVGSFSNATRDFLSAGLVERIEILHGPASPLYGSQAIGGVVAAQTPDPFRLADRQGIGGYQRTVWRDSDDSLHGSGALALAGDGKGLLLGGSLRNGSEAESSAGEQLDYRDVRRRSALAKLVLDGEDGNTWRLQLLRQDARVASDENALLGQGRYATTTALEGDDDYRMQLAGVSWEFGAPGDIVDEGVLRAYYQSTLVRQRTLDERGLAARPVAIDRYFEFDQAIRGLELTLHRRLETGRIEHRVGAGLEFREKVTEEFRDGVERGLADGLTTSVILGEVFPLRDFPRSESREWGAFVEETLDFGAWSVIAAVRADRYELSPLADPMYAEDYPFADPVALAESDLSPKLGLIFRPGDALDLYLQYTHGFRAPPYEDANIGLDIPVFNYRAVPNPDLRSERSDSLEAGIRWRGEAVTFRAALFRTDYDDFIESRVLVGTDPDSGRTLFQARNRDRAVIAGIEAGFELRFPDVLPNVVLDGSVYGARGENRDNGQPLNSVGPAQAVLGLGWTAANGRRNARLQMTSTAAWTDRDESSDALFKPAANTVLDAYLAQRIGERVTLRAGLRNLTDETYWHWSSVRGLATDDVLIPYLAEPGRNVSVGVSLEW